MAVDSKTITQNTPVATAVAFVVATLAFYGGKELTRLDMKVDGAAQRQEVQIREAKEWRGQMVEVIQELRDLSRDNKRRLDLAQEQSRQ